MQVQEGAKPTQSLADFVQRLKAGQAPTMSPLRARRRKLATVKRMLGLSSGFLRGRRTRGREKAFREALATVEDRELRQLAWETWGCKRPKKG